MKNIACWLKYDCMLVRTCSLNNWVARYFFPGRFATYKSMYRYVCLHMHIQIDMYVYICIYRYTERDTYVHVCYRNESRHTYE